MSSGKNSDVPFDPTDFDFDASPETGPADSDFTFGVEDMPEPQDRGGSKPVFSQPVDDGGFGDEDTFGASATSEDAVTDFGDPNVDTGFAPAGDDFGGGDNSVFLNKDYIADNSPGGDFGGEEASVFEPELEAAEPVVEEEPVVVRGDDRTFLQKHLFTLAAAGAGLFLLVVAYPLVSPMIFSAGPVQQDIPTITENPTSIPSGPVTEEPRPAFSEPTSPPTLPGFEAPTPLPPANASTSEPPVLLQSPADVASPSPTLPGIDSQPVDVVAPPTSQPVVASTSPVVSAEADRKIVELESQVASLTEQISALNGRLAEIEAAPVAPSTPGPAVSPVDKPAVVEGWTLRGVQGDVAWIEDAQGEFLEVSVGSDVPGGGRVTNIQMYEGDWLVVTQNGVILQN